MVTYVVLANFTDASESAYAQGVTEARGSLQGNGEDVLA